MSVIYAGLLAAVAVALLVEVIAVVRRVSTPAPWARSALRPAPVLVPVSTSDRRRQALPYIGSERRHAGAAAGSEQRRSA